MTWLLCLQADAPKPKKLSWALGHRLGCYAYKPMPQSPRKFLLEFGNFAEVVQPWGRRFERSDKHFRWEQGALRTRFGRPNHPIRIGNQEGRDEGRVQAPSAQLPSGDRD